MNPILVPISQRKPLSPRHICLFILAQTNTKLMQIRTEVEEINVNPVLNFFFALKAPESKRQYPKRFEKFLDYLKLEGTFEDKALSFYKKAIENQKEIQEKLNVIDYNDFKIKFEANPIKEYTKIVNEINKKNFKVNSLHWLK